MTYIKTVRFIRFASATILLLWVGFLFGGQHAANSVSRAAGSTLLRAGQGKFADVNIFVYARLREALFLLSVAWVLGILCWLICRTLKTLVSQKYAWAFITGVWLVALNVFVVAAMQTALFWALFWHGASTNNYAQHQFKEVLLAEAPRPQAVLLGSSQTRAQIDENVLNRELAGRLWTTELHFPGSRAFDLWLMIRRVQPQQNDLVICYLSEGYFYTGADSTSLPYFLKLTDLQEITVLGKSLWWKQRNLYYGLLGDCLPLFRLRDPVAQRFLGASMVGLEQMRHDQGLSTNLHDRAKIVAAGFRDDETTEVQKAAFRAFIAECKRLRVKLVLCAGQLNPLVYGYLTPSCREGYLGFLRQIQEANPHVAVLVPETLGWHTPETYLDLTHITKPEQTRFTLQLSAWLQQNLDTLQPLAP